MSPQLRRARLAVNLMFLTNGALFANLLPRYPLVKDALGVDAATFGLLVAGFPAGAMIAGLAAGRLMRRFTSARTALAGTFVVALALVAAAVGVRVGAPLFALAMVAGGAADAVVDVAQNAHGLRVQRAYGRSIINSFHAAWSAGAVLGGAMGSAAAAQGGRMSRQTDALAGLGRIARLKADLEMRRFAAFRAHVEAARQRIGQLEEELQALYRAEEAFSVSEARLVNALARDRSMALLGAERDLERMLPGYEQARQAAAREFGRAEAVSAVREDMVAQARLDRARRAGTT